MANVCDSSSYYTRAVFFDQILWFESNEILIIINTVPQTDERPRPQDIIFSIKSSVFSKIINMWIKISLRKP